MLRLLTFTLIFSANLLQAKVLEVCPTCPLTSIRQGIAAAGHCDTVLVQPGTYRESGLKIEKPLTLLGVNFPILDGEKKGEIITITANDVCIRGFDLRNGGVSSYEDWAGIRLLNVQRASIEGNRFHRTCYAIYIAGSIGCDILNNEIVGFPEQIAAAGKVFSHPDSYRDMPVHQSAGNGVHAWKCDQLRIEGNTVTGHRDGIYFEFVTNSGVRRNRSAGNLRYGLHFMFSHHCDYEGNTFRQNGAGVAVMYSQHVHMRQNVFEKNEGDAAYGILMKDISDSRVERNLFQHNTTGAYVEGSNRIVFEKNTFHANGWALRLQASCADNSLTFNNFTSNTFDVSTNGSHSLNHFENNFWDKYEGYDLDRNGIGDVPHRPVSLYSIVVERMPYSVMLLRSFMVGLLDRAEKVMPSLTPQNLTDSKPRMRREF